MTLNGVKCTLRKKCPYSESFWSAFFCIWIEYGEILHISPYSVRISENADLSNTEYGHFLRSGNNRKKSTYYSQYSSNSNRILSFTFKNLIFKKDDLIKN